MDIPTESELFGLLMEMVVDGRVEMTMDDEGELYFSVKKD